MNYLTYKQISFYLNTDEGVCLCLSLSLCLSPSLSDSLSVSVSLCLYLSVVVKISFKFFGVTDEFSYMVERISIRIFNLAWIGRIGRWVGKIFIMMLKNEFKHKITKQIILLLKIHKNHTWGGGIGWGLIGGLVKIDITMFKMSLEHEISLEKTRHMPLVLKIFIFM